MIKLQKKSILSILLLVCSMILFTQCEKEEDNDPKVTGQVTFEMTDAPIDNAEVSGAFVTVTDIKVDGQSINLENKQTINVLAYQNGDTKSLDIAELEAGSYSNISLVLDYAEDADGNSPGCYVLSTDNKKHDLNINGSSSNEITFSANDLSVEENGNTTVVVDFDLRKAIKKQEGNTESSYSFVSNSELNASLRTAIKAESSIIEGSCSNANTYADKVVVYAYKKGSYDRDLEMQGQGSSNVEFKNAETSAVLNANGDFSLHFLEAGEYEVHFVTYDDSNSNGEFEVSGSLETSVAIGLDLLSLSVEAGASVSLNVLALGVIPL